MIYPKNIEYLRTVRKKVYLPKGDQPHKNQLVFLYSSGIKNSIEYINGTNLHPNSFYRYYYIPYTYRLSLNNKTFRFNIRNRKRTIKETIETDTRLRLYPYEYLTNDVSKNYNTYFDLSIFIDGYKKITKSASINKKMNLFWSFLNSIINNPKYSSWDKLLLINGSQYKFNTSDKIKESINNPVYMIYYSLLHDPEVMKKVDIDILLYTDRGVLKINPSKLTAKDKPQFQAQVKLLFATSKSEEKVIDTVLDDKSIIKEERKEIVKDNIMKKMNFTGSDIANILEDDDSDEDIEVEDIKQKISSKVDSVEKEILDKLEDDNDPAIGTAIQVNTENQINEDRELIEKLYNVTMGKTVPKSKASTARDRMLKEKQKDIVVSGITLKEIEKIDSRKIPIKENDYSNALHTANENVKHNRFINFDKEYNEKLLKKDIVDSVLELNNKSIPMFIRDIKVEDTSNELNYQDTYTFLLEDGNRQRHTIKVDIPKIYDNKFLFLGGNKKLILKQNFFLPVVKIGPDTVEIVTNYNKMFITRDDTKGLGNIERFKKVLEKNDAYKECFTFYNAYPKNSNCITTLEYDELSKFIGHYKFNKLELFFDQHEAAKYIDSRKIKVPSNSMFIGMDNGEPIFIDWETQKTKNGKSIIDIIITSAPEDVKVEYDKVKFPKRLMTAKVKTMEQLITVIMLIGYWEGLTNVIKKINLDYRLTEKYPKDLTYDEEVIQFADCYLVYKSTILASILLNGLRVVDTKNYKFLDFDTPNPYLDYFLKVYGKLSIANALNNTYEFTIDNITREILIDQNLPTDIVSLVIYAVSLLEDNQFTVEINQNLSRIRSTEIIPAILYDSIAKAYINVANSSGKKKLQVPRDIVIKKLLDLKTVEDVSTLNPVLELDRCNTITAKGWRGVNLDDSYTLSKRAYDKSMTGIICMNTSPDGSTGVTKVLTADPKVKSLRGYCEDNSDDMSKLKDTNMFSYAELLIPTAGAHDDPTRVGHAVKQSKHVIPVEKSSPVLISNGMEEACRFSLSSDFCINADEDGKVVEYDEESQIMIVEYKSGKHRAINLAPFTVKNGGGGFYLSNQLTTDLKLGSKFKQNDPLAWHKNFFSTNKYNGCRMNMGTFVKVAIMSAYNTYNDATFITSKLSKDAGTEMTFAEQAVVGKNSHVDFIRKIGEHIDVDDVLISFDSSYEDESLNDFLAALSEDPDASSIVEDSKNTIKSDHAGEIVDIKIYSTVDLDELSPSLKKIVSAHYKKINKKKNLLDKYNDGEKDSIVKCGMLFTETTKKVEPSKYGVIRGQHVEESVLFEFYIKHNEELEVASKIANFTGLKNTVAEIIPEGYEPYSSYRPDEEISTFIAPSSVLKRMTPTIILQTLGNKVLVELKRQLKDIYES